MKRFIAVALLGVGTLALVYGLHAASTDIWNLAGQGTYNAQDMAKVDSSYNFRLYNGSIFLGNNQLAPSTNNTQTTPSTAVGGYYGLKVPIVYGAAVTNGDVICSSGTAGGIKCATSGQTSVIGVADNTYAAGVVGYITVAGYAVVHTTMTVTIGDILVSTVAASGYASTNNTAINGTVIGKALSTGAAGGDSVLAIMSLQ